MWTNWQFEMWYEIAARALVASRFPRSLARLTTVIVLKWTNRTNTIKRSSVVNAWCVTLRQKRNTPSLHIQYFYATNNQMCWNTHNGHAPVVHAHASTLPTLPIVWLQCTSLALWFPMCEKGKVIFKRKFLFRKMSHAFLLFQPAHFVIKNMDYLRVSGWIQYFNIQSLSADYHHKCSYCTFC